MISIDFATIKIIIKKTVNNMSTQRPSSVQSIRSSRTGKSTQILPSTIKENQLSWMFNRRKAQLYQTSKQNLQLYRRINNQKSTLTQLKANTSKEKRYCSRKKSTNEEMININSQLKRRGEEINYILAAYTEGNSNFNSKINSRLIR